MKSKLLTSLLLFLLIFPNMVSGYDLDIDYKSISGETESFDQFDGELLLVEAFSTECSHCIDYHPTLGQIYEENNQTIKMVSLSINNDDSIETLQEFKEDHPTEWIMGLDIENEFQNAFGIRGTPTTLLFNGDGELTSCVTGNRDRGVIQTEIDNLVADPSGYRADNLDDGQCASPSIFSQFINSILFPILLGILLYVAYTIYQRRKSE